MVSNRHSSPNAEIFELAVRQFFRNINQALRLKSTQTAILNAKLAKLFPRKQVALPNQLKHHLVCQGSIKPNRNPVIFIHVISRENMVTCFGEVISLIFIKLEINNVDCFILF